MTTIKTILLGIYVILSMPIMILAAVVGFIVEEIMAGFRIGRERWWTLQEWCKSFGS